MKGVQRGLASFSNSAITITAVNMSKSFMLGNNFGVMNIDSAAPYRVTLANSTTVQFAPAAGSTGNGNPAWQVIEFW